MGLIVRAPYFVRHKPACLSGQAGLYLLFTLYKVLLA